MLRLIFSTAFKNNVVWILFSFSKEEVLESSIKYQKYPYLTFMVKHMVAAMNFKHELGDRYSDLSFFHCIQSLLKVFEKLID